MAILPTADLPSAVTDAKFQVAGGSNAMDTFDTLKYLHEMGSQLKHDPRMCIAAPVSWILNGANG